MKFSHKRTTAQRQRGFTLIEVMVVLVILAILGTFVTLNVIDRPDQARTEKVKNDIRAIENALSLYRLDNFSYPSGADGLSALVPKYLPKMPKDPWENEYHYANPGEHGEVDIMSYGSDARQGGDGQSADLGNWNID